MVLGSFTRAFHETSFSRRKENTIIRSCHEDPFWNVDNLKRPWEKGKTLAEQEFSKDSDEDDDMSLADDNDKEDTEIKALTDSGTDLIEIDGSEADEKDALD